MVTLNDKYIPTEGINFTFSEIENCELSTRPSNIGFKGKSFWFKKRDGVESSELWVTKGNILSSNLFQQKINTYTDEGFLYTFDGEIMEALNTDPAASISQNTGNTALDLDVSSNLLSQGQEFTMTENSVLRNITVRLRSVGTLTASVFIRCRITTAAAKNTVVFSSQDIYSGLLVGGSYSDFTFNFNNVYFPNASQYFFYIEAENTDGTNYIEVEAQTGNPYAGGASFNYDGSTWTQNGTDDMRFSLDMTGQQYYSTAYDDTIMPVSYLGGGRYPNASTTRVVNTYNNTTGEITVTVALPGSVGDFIGKYVYISAGAIGGLRQYGFISDQSSSTSIRVSVPFTVDITAGDTLIFYNSIEQQLFFPRLRKGSNSTDIQYLYSRSRSGQNQYWYYPTSRKLVFWDNRVVSLRLDGQGILFYDAKDIEVPSTLTVSFGNESVLDIAPYGAYLMCFFKNKIGIIRKTVVNATLGTIAYIYQDLVSEGLFSAKSYLIKASDLFVFTTDKRLYSVDISTLTINELSAELKDQGDILDNYLAAFSDGGEVTFNFVGDTLRLIYKIGNTTEAYKYLGSYQVRVRDVYTFSQNFLGWLYNINDNRTSAYENQFVVFRGIQDLGNNISQRIKIYGPEEGLMSTFTLLKTKLRIGFDYIHQIGGVIKLQIGGYKLTNKVYDLSSIDVIQEINSVISSQGLIGEPQVAQYMIGGEYYNQSQLKEIFPEIIDVGFNVGNKGQYFTIEITNDENKQLYLNVIDPIYNTESELVISNKGVIPRE